MNGPFDHGIGSQELALFLAISEESAQMAQEEQERLLQEQEQEEPDALDEDDESLPGL